MNISRTNTDFNRYANNYIAHEEKFKFNNSDYNYDYNQEKNNFDNQTDVLNKRNNIMTPKTYDIPVEKLYTATPGLFGARHTPDYDNLKNRNSDRYNPVGDYLNNKNTQNSISITRTTSNYINIDSRLRNKNPSYKNTNYITLPNNPLQFTYGSNIMTVFVNSLETDFPNLSPNDKISLIGLTNTIKIVNNTQSNPILIFTENSNYVKINYLHQMYFTDANTASKYDTTDLYIELSGIIGDASSNGIFIGNIPISSLNTINKIYLLNPELDLDSSNNYSNNWFWVKLVRPYFNNNLPIITYGVSNYNIKIIYRYSYGIANNAINAQFPISAYNINGYLIVKEVFTNYFTINININKSASFNYNTNNNTQINFGGSNINVSVLGEIIEGYPSPTSYKIQLDKIYNNAILIRLISSEFPNLNKVVYSYENSTNFLSQSHSQSSNNPTNNKLYWQNQDDGDNIYSVQIPQGNYNMDELINTIENKIIQVPRINNNLGNYNLNNIIKINYNSINNEILFSSYKEIVLIQPIVNITNISTGSYNLQIYHTNHHLHIGDIITISGCMDVSNILANDINRTLAISQILDNDNYIITLTNINPTGTSPSITKGGNSVKIITNNIFRLLFNYPDTLGNFFGFRKLNNSQSITKYASTISNRSLYYSEYLDEQLLGLVQESETYQLRSIDLDSDNYILMTCDSEDIPTEIINQMSVLSGTNVYQSNIKNIFAKIQFNNTKIANKLTLYNTFIQNPMYIHNPIEEIKSLYINFFDKYGNKLEYSDFEHSMTFEIVTISEIPEGTNFSAHYPKIN